MKSILVVEDDQSTQFVYSIWLDEYELFVKTQRKLFTLRHHGSGTKNILATY